MEDRAEDVSKFWDIYGDEGIEAAVDFAKDNTDGNILVMQEIIPSLIEEAKERGIDMMEFLMELDSVEGAVEDAAGTDNDGSELLVDSSDNADESQDEDEPAEESAPAEPVVSGTEES